MTSLLRCSICKSSAIKEEFKGAEITCTECGYVGCIESVYSLAGLKDSLESDQDRKHRDMEAFAAEIERKCRHIRFFKSCLR